LGFVSSIRSRATVTRDYFDLREHNSVFEDVVAYVPGGKRVLLNPRQSPVQFGAAHVSANFMSLFGIRPQLGQGFTADEENHYEPVTMISNSFWHEHYNADPHVLGKTAS